MIEFFKSQIVFFNTVIYFAESMPAAKAYPDFGQETLEELAEKDRFFKVGTLILQNMFLRCVLSFI